MITKERVSVHWDANAFSNEKEKFHATLSRQTAFLLLAFYIIREGKGQPKQCLSTHLQEGSIYATAYLPINYVKWYR